MNIAWRTETGLVPGWILDGDCFDEFSPKITTCQFYGTNCR